MVSALADKNLDSLHSHCNGHEGRSLLQHSTFGGAVCRSIRGGDKMQVGRTASQNLYLLLLFAALVAC